MSKRFYIANTIPDGRPFNAPVELITSTNIALGQRGSGKTHAGSVMAEEMLKAGQPPVIYDPTGAWWGLKSSADGKAPGYPVVIFGGDGEGVGAEDEWRMNYER